MGLQGLDLEPVEHAGMQATHEAELKLLRQLDRLLVERAEGKGSDRTIDEPLAELLAHIEAHFAEEEWLMAIHPFPPAEAHSAEHRHAIAALRRVIGTWQRERDLTALVHALSNEHIARMRRHVATMDYVTARFLVMVQQTGGG